MSGIYRKGEVIGWGSFAAVYEGWGELLNRPVAVKELVQPFAGNDPFVRAYLNQALKMVDIAHSHVLATYATDTSRNVPTVIRELADDTLGHRLIEGPRPPEEVARILRHVLSGLDAIHSRDILHRAVKPENVFICEHGYKIGDFGPVAPDGAPPIPPGHLKYAAPETLAQSEREGPGSDLYSLGMVAYELFLGPVRLEQTIEELLRRSGVWTEERLHTAGRGDQLWPSFHLAEVEFSPLHELDPNIPIAFSLALQKMMRKDPAARFSTCREVLAALGAAGVIEQPGETRAVKIVRDRKAAAPQVGSPRGRDRGPLPSAARNHRQLWLLGGLATAVVAGTVGILESGGYGWGSRPGTAKAGLTAEPSPPAPADRPVAAIRAELLGLANGRGGPQLDLDPPRPGARIPIGADLGFRVAVDRPGYLLVFSLDPNGLITCFYPNTKQGSRKIASGETLTLPSPEADIKLEAQAPEGTSLVFALRSDHPLPLMPAGDATQPWMSTYPFLPGIPENPAPRFADWVAGLHRQSPSGVQLTARKIEITSER